MDDVKDKTHGMLLTCNFAAPGFLLFDVGSTKKCWLNFYLILEVSCIFIGQLDFIEGLS